MKKIFEIIQKWQGGNFTTVWVADTTPKEGASYKELNYEEFAKMHRFQPIETTVPFPASEKMQVEGDLHKSLKVTAYLKFPHNKLFLAPMDQPLNTPKIDGLGYAVYYNPCEEKEIKPGTMVSHYAGVSIKETGDRLYDYIYNMTDAVMIDAERQGNLSRFFAHLPSAAELKFFVMPKNIRRAIATANLEMQPYEYGGQGALAVVTTQSVNPAEMMGYSYNIDYFLNRGTLPIYYDKKGYPLDLSNVTFDKRRYLLFSFFNQQIHYFNQMICKGTRLTSEWTSVYGNLAKAVHAFDNYDANYFDLEGNFKALFPQLKKAYSEHRFGEALEKLSLARDVGLKEALRVMEMILFFNKDDSVANMMIDQLFQMSFNNFPADHPRAKTHTLDLSKPKEKSAENPPKSSVRMFDAGRSSQTTTPSSDSSEGEARMSSGHK